MSHHHGSTSISRRTAVGALATSAVATGLAPILVAGQEHTHNQATPAASPVSAPATPQDATPMPVTTQELVQPELLSSVDGVLNVELTCAITEVDLGVGHPVMAWSYNGTVPGPTLEVRPGDWLNIHLINNLPEIPEGQDPQVLDRPHAWTTTNLHTHGLHVSPSGNADNVFLELAPGDDMQLEIPLADNESGGFNWYHPHKHGAVCQQVRAGMAGGLIVRGEIDDVPEVAAAREQIMVLQAIELGDDFAVPDPIPVPGPNQAFYPRTQIFYTVNGQYLPKVTMYPGEVQHWRMVNAAEGKFLSLHIQDHDFNVVAWDGLTMHEPEATSDIMMSSGNRVEALVKAGAPGIYEVVLTPGSSQHPNMPGMDHSDIVDQADRSAELKIRPIFYLEVVGEGEEMFLPETLPAYDPPIHDIVKTRLVRYTVERGSDGVEFISFGIDGKPYRAENPPYQMKLGTAEEWIVMNDADGKYAEHAHALHIHVNPFKVIKVNGVTLEKPYWRDTMAISGRDGDWFAMQINIDDFTGLTVQHCHVLSHEDLGMMEAIEIVE